MFHIVNHAVAIFTDSLYLKSYYSINDIFVFVSTQKPEHVDFQICYNIDNDFEFICSMLCYGNDNTIAQYQISMDVPCYTKVVSSEQRAIVRFDILKLIIATR